MNGDNMFHNYKIINGVLYLYVSNMNEISSFNNTENEKRSLYIKVNNYIRNKGIEYDGNHVYLVVNGLVIGSMLLKTKKDTVDHFIPIYEYVNVIKNLKGEEIELLDINETPSSKFIDLEHSNGIINQIYIEQYVFGTIATEMPIYYEKEALKAQAILTRTKAYQKLLAKEPIKNNVLNKHYNTIEDLKQVWKERFEYNFRKLQDVIYETRGQFLEYDGNPIFVHYHALNNGHTEDSTTYLEKEIPYLKKVSCEADAKVKMFDNLTIDYKTISRILKQDITNKTKFKKMTINQRHYIQVGRTLYDVKTFANILKLHSPIFKIDTTSEGVVIKGKGLGTPLGMSQHSANEMAKQKKTYQEILNYFYPGTNIRHI